MKINNFNNPILLFSLEIKPNPVFLLCFSLIPFKFKSIFHLNFHFHLQGCYYLLLIFLSNFNIVLFLFLSIHIFSFIHFIYLTFNYLINLLTHHLFLIILIILHLSFNNILLFPINLLFLY